MKIWHPGDKTSQGDKWNEQILISDKLKYMHIDCLLDYGKNHLNVQSAPFYTVK